MDKPTPWMCPSCKVAVLTPFCAHCGEDPVVPADLSIRGVAAKLLHALTSIDARAVRSTRLLLRKPGDLTLAWISGIRKPYVAPFQLFLIANVLFFGVQWATGDNVFSSSLESHLHHQDWSGIAQSFLSRRLEQTHTTLAEFEPAFNRAVVLNAKSLILLMTMAFAVPLPLVFMAKRRPFMTHVVFSLHLYTFLLLLFCLSLLVAKLSILLGFGGLDTAVVDNLLSVINLSACTAYIYLAIQPVYGATGASRVAKAILLSVTVAAIVLGYRFVLFFITLYGT